MGPSITLWQAIETWLAGQEIDRNAVLWGLDVTWWARIAKVGQFVAATTVVIEIVGVANARAWVRQAFRASGSKTFIFGVLPGLTLLIGLLSASFTVSGKDALAYVEAALNYLAYFVITSLAVTGAGLVLILSLFGLLIMLESPSWARLTRNSAFALLTVSVLLDLLTS